MKLNCKYLTVYICELTCLGVILALPFNLFFKPIFFREIAIERLNQNPSIEARLFRVVKRERFHYGTFDDAGLGKINRPSFFLETPIGSMKTRQLNTYDFYVINERSLKVNFRVDGSADCPLCPFDGTKVPYQSVVVKIGEVSGKKVALIEGFERIAKPWYIWLLGIIVLAYSITILVATLIVIWKKYVVGIVNSYSGIHPSKTASLILSRIWEKQQWESEALFNAGMVVVVTLPFALIGYLLFSKF